MKRRDFISLLGGAAAWPVAARAQEASRVYTLGAIIPVGRNTPAIEAFFDEMRLFGFIEGKNLDDTLVVRKFVFGEDFGCCRTSDLADAEETFEVRMRAEYRLRHRDRLGQVIFGAFGIDDRDLRISCQCFLYPGRPDRRRSASTGHGPRCAS